MINFEDPIKIFRRETSPFTYYELSLILPKMAICKRENYVVGKSYNFKISFPSKLKVTFSNDFSGNRVDFLDIQIKLLGFGFIFVYQDGY